MRISIVIVLSFILFEEITSSSRCKDSSDKSDSWEYIAHGASAENKTKTNVWKNQCLLDNLGIIVKQLKSNKMIFHCSCKQAPFLNENLLGIPSGESDTLSTEDFDSSSSIMMFSRHLKCLKWIENINGLIKRCCKSTVTWFVSDILRTFRLNNSILLRTRIHW